MRLTKTVPIGHNYRRNEISVDPIQNDPTEQGAPEPSSQQRESGGLQAAGWPPRLFRVRLWQSIGGMSVAIAIASLIVLLEVSASKARLNNYVNRQVAALNATVRTLRHQKAVEQRTL